jgi:hypothetical protein
MDQMLAMIHPITNVNRNCIREIFKLRVELVSSPFAESIAALGTRTHFLFAPRNHVFQAPVTSWANEQFNGACVNWEKSLHIKVEQHLSRGFQGY